MTAAPTTDSLTAASMSPTRSRTSGVGAGQPALEARQRDSQRQEADPHQQGELPGVDDISTVATTSWPSATMIIRPPHCMNVLIWSTSLVTRETRAPRRSVCWVSTDRSCTCRKPRTRSVARRGLGRLVEAHVHQVAGERGEHHGAPRTARTAGADERQVGAAGRARCRWSAAPRSARRPGRRWRPRPAASVPPSPLRNSGVSDSPRRIGGPGRPPAPCSTRSCSRGLTLMR